MRISSKVIAIAVVSLTSNVFSAAVIVQPTSATDSQHFGSSDAEQTRNASSFTAGDAAVIANGQPVPAVWPSASGGFGGNYVSNGGAPNPIYTITYTLSATPVDIAGLHYWPYNGDGTGRDLKSFDIAFSADGTTYGTAQSFANLPQLGGDNQATAGIDLTLSSTASGVKFAMITNMVNYGTPDCCGSFDGIQEVRFVTPVPEPVTLTAGVLGGLGLLIRRRRSV